MLYARVDANAGRRGVFKSSATPLLPPRRDVASPPVLCPELPPHHLPRLAMQVIVFPSLDPSTTGNPFLATNYLELV